MTSARHDVFSKILADKYPESFDPMLPENLTYSGSKELTSTLEGVPLDIGKLVLSPTRTYAPVIKKIFSQMGTGSIHGMVHCSGGAQTKILHFVNNLHIIKDSLFPVPPLFDLIQKESGASGREMYQVFNMGHRMEFYVTPDKVEEIISISDSFKIKAQIIGRVEAAPKTKLTLETIYGTFNY